jgi:hypothetical protein
MWTTRPRSTLGKCLQTRGRVSDSNARDAAAGLPWLAQFTEAAISAPLAVE